MTSKSNAAPIHIRFTLKGKVRYLATSFSVLRAVYNKAVKQKVFAETDNPFKQYNIGRFWKPTRKRAITKEDVQKIQSLKLPESTESYSLSFARDIFLFSYYR